MGSRMDKYNNIDDSVVPKRSEKNKELYKNAGFGEYLNNDRFIFKEKPSICTIKIRKTYEIAL